MCPWKSPQSSAQRIEKLRTSLGPNVGDVVDSRIGVGLDPQVVGPERVDHVERGDVQRDVPVDRQHQVRRLHAAEGRVAIGERPLLADHLHRELVPDGLAIGSAPCPPPEPSSKSRMVP